MFTQKNKAGRTALRGAYYHRNHDAFKSILAAEIACIKLNKLKPEVLLADLQYVYYSGTNLLMSIARGYPGLVSSLLVAVTDPDVCNAQAFRSIFTQENNDGDTVLILALKYQPKIFKLIVEAMLERIKNASSLSDVFVHAMKWEVGGSNLLLYAAEHQPTLVAPILEALETAHTHGTLSGDEFQAMFTQKNKAGRTALRGAYYHRNHDAFKSILAAEIACIKLNKLKPEVLLADLQYVYYSGTNLLMSIARGYPGLVSSLLVAVTDPDVCNAQAFRSIFTQENNDGDTVLILALKYQPKIFKLIVEAMLERIKNASSLSDVFVNAMKWGLLNDTENSDESNILMYAAKNQPTLVAPILKVLQQAKDQSTFSDDDYQTMFTQTNEDGDTALVLALKHSHNVPIQQELFNAYRQYFTENELAGQLAERISKNKKSFDVLIQIRSALYRSNEESLALGVLEQQALWPVLRQKNKAGHDYLAHCAKSGMSDDKFLNAFFAMRRGSFPFISERSLHDVLICLKRTPDNAYAVQALKTILQVKLNDYIQKLDNRIQGNRGYSGSFFGKFGFSAQTKSLVAKKLLSRMKNNESIQAFFDAEDQASGHLRAAAKQPRSELGSWTRLALELENISRNNSNQNENIGRRSNP